MVYPNVSNRTILIVDHDATNRRLARRLLESAGFDVVEATDAVGTLEVLKTRRPRMIVLDIQLPGIDGWELTRRLKRNFATRDIPVIVTTAFASEGDRSYAIESGCAAFIEQPINSSELPMIIRRWLDEH